MIFTGKKDIVKISSDTQNSNSGHPVVRRNWRDGSVCIALFSLGTEHEEL